MPSLTAHWQAAKPRMAGAVLCWNGNYLLTMLNIHWLQDIVHLKSK
jgi:hypothetical protein